MIFLVTRALCVILLLAVTAGCSVIDVRARIDPAGDVLTDSTACVYDFDRFGLWYVVFVKREGLLQAVHRHNPGIHLFISDGDLLFYSRCSGRGEAIDVMGQTFSLRRGAVFLCAMEDGKTTVRQLDVPTPPCRDSDPASIDRAMFELSLNPKVASFVDDESRQRLRARWQIARKAGQPPADPSK